MVNPSARASCASHTLAASTNGLWTPPFSAIAITLKFGDACCAEAAQAELRRTRSNEISNNNRKVPDDAHCVCNIGRPGFPIHFGEEHANRGVRAIVNR